jgi:nucleoid DNA-binding protein
MITKTDLAAEISELTGIPPKSVKQVFNALAEIAQDEISAGEDFSVPGVARITWAYTKPLAKGERYKKGEEYVGFGGVELVAEEDSKARKASVKLKAAPAPALKRVAPKRASMTRFMSSKLGKTIAARKS